MNLFFLNYAERHWFIILILLAHSTHWLQLLVVGLFSSFSKAYSEKQSEFMMKSQPFVYMNKKIFYPFFKRA